MRGQPALNRALAGPRIGGVYKMQPTAGAVRRRIGPSRRTHFLAASMGGRAAWPPVRLSCGAEERCGAALRGHARDDISRVRSGIQGFEELIEGTTEAYPQVSRM